MPNQNLTDDEFIRQMTVGTSSEDIERDPNFGADVVRGIQYTPFDVLGAPVDIATMVMRPFGYDVQKPVGGSDWFIEQAAKRGLAQPSTGSGAELLGRITGGVATPAVARGVGRVGQATENFISGQLDTAANRVEENTLAKLRQQTGNPNLTAQEVYSAMFGKQAPGAAITKPTGPTTAPVQAPQTPLGFYSAVEDTILKLPQEKGTAQQLLAQISKAPGVKTKEVEATGLAEFLRSKGTAPVTKQEIQDFLANNRVQVDEVVLGKGKVLSPEAKRRMDDTLSKMVAIDEKLAEYFEGPVRSTEKTFMYSNLRGTLGRNAAAGDPQALEEINALNIPQEIKQLAIQFGQYKNEYTTFAKQSLPIQKPKFDRYNIPGGENAREIYLTLPGMQKQASFSLADKERLDELAAMRVENSLDGLSPAQQREYFALLDKREKTGALYTAPGSHSVSPEADTNRIAHIFLDDRTDAQGNKTLFVQELQSDWAQQGRDTGFKSPPDPIALEAAKNKVSQTEQALRQKFEDLFNRGERAQDHPERLAALEQVTQAREELQTLLQDSRLPPAPFVTNTEDWLNLALKRVIKEAVDSGADNVAFIKGEQAADKYSLRTLVDKIRVATFLSGDNKAVYIVPKNETAQIELFVNKDGIIEGASSSRVSEFKNKPLSEVVGKELAEKIMSGKDQVISGEGLEMGGEGMKGFYDNIVPKTAKKLLEKLGGGKVKTIELEKEIPSRLQNYASSFMDWMSTRHPEVSSEDAARAWAMGMDNNEFVKEYYEATKPVKYIGFEITPEMRELIKGQGLPQFAAGGEVTTDEFIRRRANGSPPEGEMTDEDFIQQMTVGTPPTDQGPRPYDQTAVAQFADYLRAPVDLAQTAVRGTVGAVVGPAYGVYKGLTGGKYGTPEGVREASEAGGQLMQRITGEPKSQAARDVLEFIGKKAEEYKLAPMPQLMTLPVPGPGAVQYPLQAAKTQAEDIALRAVRSQTENPDITASQLYNAMLGKQAPGAAAVKPRGGIVITEKGSPVGNYIEDVITSVNREGYRATVPESNRVDVADFIAKKMPKYLRSDFGTENDPIREAVQSGRIGLFGRDKEKLRGYALAAAREGEPEALQDVTRAYDRGTGLRPFVIKPDELDYDATAELKNKAVDRLVQRMVAEGADENLSRAILSEQLEDVTLKDLEAAALADAGDIRSNFGTSAQALASFGGKDQTEFIRRAVEQGDIAFGMGSFRLLSMFEPEAIAKTIGAVPPEKLARMSFPEAFIEGTNLLKSTRDFEVALDIARRGKGNTLPKETLFFGTKPQTKVKSGQWVRITDPLAAKLEGALMGHSVGGYGDEGSYNLGGKKALMSGKANVFSLRDEKGFPMATIEMEDMNAGTDKAPDFKIRQTQGRFNSAPEEYMDDVFDLADNLNARWPEGLAGDQTYHVDRSGKSLEEVKRIKWGDLYRQRKQNRPPEGMAAGGEVTNFIRAHA